MKPILLLLSLMLISCTNKKIRVDLIINNAKVYTVNNSFEPAESFAIRDGRFIEVGKFADFVVLEQDIMTIDIKEVPKVKVLETYIGGEKVY